MFLYRRHLLASFIGLILFLPISLIAQTNTFPTSGNAGIGTISPTYPLHLYTSVNSRARFQFESKFLDLVSFGPGSHAYSDSHGIFLTGNKGLIMTGANSDLIIVTNNGSYTERIRVKSDGKVGIGTSSPSYNLQVSGNSKWTGNASSYTEVNSNSYGQYFRQYGNDGTTQSWIIRGYANPFQAEFTQGGISANGTVKAKEVNVTATGWADYVFDNTYHLKPLEEVQEFYHRNGHLENIPTEKEVLEHGVNLSEMTVKLLEKVEELTIYLVEQNERIKALELQLKNAQIQK